MADDDSLIGGATFFTGVHQDIKSKVPRSWKKTFTGDCLLSWLQKTMLDTEADN